MLHPQEANLINRLIDNRKSIFIVVKDQLNYLQSCIESIELYTDNYDLYIWDNASSEDTHSYLLNLWRNYKSSKNNIYLFRSKSNKGFIYPNKSMAFHASKINNSDYFIFLNSDTYVEKFWDTLLIAFLQNNPRTLQVGYSGGLLNQNGIGVKEVTGDSIDYVCGWCFAISIDTYLKFGLFEDNNICFAYFEDSDYSLTLKSLGFEIYALHSKLVYHYGSITSKSLINQKDHNLLNYFSKNQKHFCSKWKLILDDKKVLT